MGACASVSKAMRGDAAPPPEPQKEVITTTEVAEKDVVVVEGEKKKVDGGGDEKVKVGDDEKNEDGEEGDEADKHQSLGSLLNESVEAKVSPPETEKITIIETPETEKTTVAETAALETVKSDEQKPEVVPVASEENAATYVPPVAHVTTEEKKETETITKEEK
ncbi:hypothetical protein ACSBR1_019203 [Camellia fascicularis]